MTLTVAGERWFVTRIDVAESTKTRNSLELGRIRRLLGSRTLDDVVPADVVDFVATLVEESYAAGRSARRCKRSRWCSIMPV